MLTRHTKPDSIRQDACPKLKDDYFWPAKFAGIELAAGYLILPIASSSAVATSD